MGISRHITVAGKTIFTKIIHERRPRVPGEKRAKKEKPTIESVQKLNEKYAIRDLSIILNHNFKEGDYHLVLTYKGEPPKAEEAKKNLERFCRKMNDRYKKEKIIFKRVSVTEYKSHRPHHHIVCTAGASAETLAKLWPHGYVYAVALDNTGDYRKLAEYLIKETSKHFRDIDTIYHRRYNCSRSIERPITKKETVSYRIIVEDPKAFKDYYIDQDSIYRGEDPLTGHGYIEFVQLSLKNEPRIKKYRRGKKQRQKTNPYIKYLKENEPEQTRMNITRLNVTTFTEKCGGLLAMADICKKIKGE